MSKSSISDKTIRPGSLNGYSYYYSGKKTEAKTKSKPKAEKKSRRKVYFILLLILGVGFWLGFSDGDSKNSSQQPAASSAAITPATSSKSEATPVNNCAGNDLDKLIKVSVDKRRMWACEKTNSVHSVSVITGLKNHPETETPLGTYKIYGKMTNTTLSGNDSRGAWKYPVYYWMPFLDNQYGTYGFHDATWRPNSEFGGISPESDKASHGCIELPLSSAKWLYEWAPVGTVVKVES